MTVTRISGRINQCVRNALQRFDEGEDINYELMFAPHPESGAIGILYIEIPSLVLGEKIGTQQVFSATNFDEDGLTEMVRQLMVALRSNRSTMASEQIKEVSVLKGLTPPGQRG